MNRYDRKLIQLQINEIKPELNYVTADNFARKNPRTYNPEKLTDSFSSLLDKIENLVSEASSKCPELEVDALLKKGKRLVDVQNRFVSSKDLEKAKQNFTELIKIIESQLQEENVPSANPSESENIIFISYYNEKNLEGVKSALRILKNLLKQVESVKDDFKTIARSQLSSLDTISVRVDEICQCSSAIICLPPKNMQQEAIGKLAYFDLGSCLTRFPKRTVLINEGNHLPEDLISKVEVLHDCGNLDWQTRTGLASKILEILKED